MSNQPDASSVQKLGHQYIEWLVDGDIRIVGKFADKPTILNNQEFPEGDRLSIQKQCQQITTQPLGIGQPPETSFSENTSHALEVSQRLCKNCGLWHLEELRHGASSTAECI